MCMVWYVYSKSSHVYECLSCDEDKRRARNCGGGYNHEGFRFQIGKIERREDLRDKFIYECPTGYISQFTRGLWNKYQDVKIRHEIGMSSNRLKKLHFEAFKIFMFSIQEFEENERKKDEKKHKANMKGGKNWQKQP